MPGQVLLYHISVKHSGKWAFTALQWSHTGVGLINGPWRIVVLKKCTSNQQSSRIKRLAFGTYQPVLEEEYKHAPGSKRKRFIQCFCANSTRLTQQQLIRLHWSDFSLLNRKMFLRKWRYFSAQPLGVNGGCKNVQFKSCVRLHVEMSNKMSCYKLIGSFRTSYCFGVSHI